MIPHSIPLGKKMVVYMILQIKSNHTLKQITMSDSKSFLDIFTSLTSSLHFMSCIIYIAQTLKKSLEKRLKIAQKIHKVQNDLYEQSFGSIAMYPLPSQYFPASWIPEIK